MLLSGKTNSNVSSLQFKNKPWFAFISKSLSNIESHRWLRRGTLICPAMLNSLFAAMVQTMVELC